MLDIDACWLFSNIFSHSVGCFLVLFIVSFAVQNLGPICLFLIRSHLLILAFVSYFRRQIQKKILPWFMSKKCSTYVFL